MAMAFFERKPVLHIGLRGTFETKKETVTLRISGRTVFMFYLDGEFRGDGPSRFPACHPQYTAHTFVLEAGEHTLAVLWQYIDMETRLVDNELDPFFYWELIGEDGRNIPLELYYRELGGYDTHLGFRMATTFGILEWCADSTDLVALTAPQTDHSGWQKLEPTATPILITEDPTRPVLHLKEQLTPIQSGVLTEEFGYERDCAAARFFLRQLDDCKAPTQGVYYRYDLGAVKLTRPCFVLDLPKGATVEIASSEQLVHGRVNPFLPLTGALGTNMVHYKAAGGTQTFMPLTPLGGRYVELHIVCEQEEAPLIRVLEQSNYWRTFFDKEPGRFRCDDDRLNQIWQMSVDTLRSCTEDVVTDCPSRERGQWTGDCSVVGLRTTSIAYGDMQVIRKSLLQATKLPDENGILPCLFPGQKGYFVTYALLWVAGLMDYYMATGDRLLLEQTYPAATRFMAYMQRCFEPESGRLLQDGRDVDCGFIDWGYEVVSGKMILPVIGMYLLALRAFASIQRVLGETDAETIRQAQTVCDTLQREAAANSMEEIGYHGVVLLLKTGVLSEAQRQEAIAYIKKFVLDCFPNKLDAPRLYSPTIFLKQVITPYFYNFTLGALMENGETEFVLSQIKSCWGYMLDNGDTTCLEVFDHRWSHCHQWSGCPGWLLSGYGLGLFKRYDLGDRHVELDLRPGNLQQAEGVLPLANGEQIHIRWQKDDRIRYCITPDVDIHLHVDDAVVFCPRGQKTELCLERSFVDPPALPSSAV